MQRLKFNKQKEFNFQNINFVQTEILFAMVSRILIYRNPLKRKKADTSKSNAPAQKAGVVMMKQLVKEYNKVKNKENDVTYYFNCFFEKNKLIYPWLKKDTLRWHVRANNKLVNSTSATTTKTKTTSTSTNTNDQPPNCLETTIIDQNQVSITWLSI